MRALLALPLALAAAAFAPPSRATGMHGHVWSSHCALETLPSGRLKTLLESQRLRLDNGSFFPDSGYAAKHEYGETAHWEKFVDGYVKWLRAKHADPMKSAPEHVAFLMGAASHGLVDQTFDILFMDKVREVHGEVDDLDTSMDVFLAVDRKYVPDFAYDAPSLVDVFAKNVGLTVGEGDIKRGMDLARVGMGFVTEILWKDAANREKRYSWARASYQDPRVAGSYPWGALAVARYWESIARRLEGDTSAESLVIASDPPPNGKVRGLAAGRVDSYLTLFVGQGLARASITSASFHVIDAAGTVVPTDIRLRGDEWATTLQLKPKSDWAPDAKYTLILDSTVETLRGVRPSKRFELPFTTPCKGCSAAPTGAPPPSPCPATLVAHPRPKDDEDPPPPPRADPPPEPSSGCTASRSAHGSALALALAALALARRRRASS